MKDLPKRLDTTLPRRKGAETYLSEWTREAVACLLDDVRDLVGVGHEALLSRVLDGHAAASPTFGT